LHTVLIGWLHSPNGDVSPALTKIIRFRVAQIEKVNDMVYRLGLSGRFEDYPHVWPSSASAISMLMVNEYDFFARPPLPNPDDTSYGPAWHKPYHFLAQTLLDSGYTKENACRAFDMIIYKAKQYGTALARLEKKKKGYAGSTIRAQMVQLNQDTIRRQAQQSNYARPRLQAIGSPKSAFI